MGSLLFGLPFGLRYGKNTLWSRYQRDWVNSLETEIEIFFYWVLILRPRLFSWSLNYKTETETFFSESQLRDRDWDFFFKYRDRDWDWDCHWSQNRDRDWDFFEILVHLWNSLSWVSCKFKMDNIEWVYSLQKTIYTPHSSGHFQYLPWLDSIHV